MAKPAEGLHEDMELTVNVAGLFPQKVMVDPRVDPDPEEPLGIEYVLAAAAKQGHQTRLFTPLDAPLESLGSVVAEYSPDVVAASVYTHHVPDVLRILATVRTLRPGVVTVVGGPHPSAAPAIVTDPNVDVAVLGEGENAFCELLSVLACGGEPANVDCLAYATDGTVTLTGGRQRISNLDSLPLPAYERRYYDLPAHSVSSPPPSHVIYAPMLLSRGCRMNCRFCSSQALWGREVLHRSPGDVVSEMKHLRDTYGVNYICFEDLAFASAKAAMRGLCDLLAGEQFGVNWACETHTNSVTRADLTAMRKAGCSKILWGIETVDDLALRRMKKGQTVADVSRSLSAAANLGILNWGCCMIGFAWETEVDILRAAERLLTLDIHQLRISIATPFPGSEWYRDLPPSALHPDLSLYDTNHLVYDHPTISPERMKELQNEVFRRFYRSPKYRNRVSRMVRKFPHLRESFDEWLAYIDENLARLDAGETELTRVLTRADMPREEIHA